MTKQPWNDGEPLPDLRMSNTPAVPREQMWARIASERNQRRTRQRRRARVLKVVLGVAMLTTGYAGRWAQDLSRQSVNVRANAVTQASPGARTLQKSQAVVAKPQLWVDTVFVANLASSDSLINVFRLASSNADVQQAIGPWARQLLGTTRLLSQAHAVSDSALLALVADLDLVLGQIAMAAENPAQGSIDRRMAGDAIASTNIVTRLQLVLQASGSLLPDRGANGSIQ